MEDITDAYYRHEQWVCKDFEIKNLGEYHGLYIQSDTLFSLMCLRNFEIYEFEILKYMNLILLVFLLPELYHGKQP